MQITVYAKRAISSSYLRILSASVYDPKLYFGGWTEEN